MNALVKLVIFFAVLGVLGAGLFFFPQSPFYNPKIYTFIIEREVPVEVVAEEEVTETQPVDAIERQTTIEEINDGVPEIISEEIELEQVPAFNE